MKNTTKIISAFAMLLSLAACSTKVDYVQVPFAALDHDSYSVKESVGQFSIPVHNFSSTDCSVTFDAVDVTAQKGVDYTVEGNGVLELKAGETKNIVVKVIPHPGTFTGNLVFGVELKSCSNGVVPSGTTFAAVEIGDEDHPLLDMFGSYTMYGVALNSNKAYGYYNWPLEISEYPNNVNRVYLSALVPLMSAYGSYLPKGIAVYGVVNATKDKITVPLPQATPSYLTDLFSGVPDEPFTFFYWNGANANGEFVTEPAEIVFELQTDGTWVTSDPYGLSGAEYISSTGDTEWFYYYMNAFSQFGANYPTYFEKN